jgi:subtilisin-like proprotein convertase family protein
VSKLIRRGIPAIVACLLVASCSGGGDDADREPSGAGDGTTTSSGGAGGGADDSAAVAAADEYVAGLDLGDEIRASLQEDGTRHSPGVTHVRYRQVYDDVPVRAAHLIVHVADDGSVLGASTSLTDLVPAPGVEQQLDEAEATEVANKAITQEVEETTSAREVWLPDGDTLRLGWSIQMATPNDSYVVWVDAQTGEVADARRTRRDLSQFGTESDCGLDDIDGPAACVYFPDPTTSDDVTDEDDADDTRRPEPLLGLDDPESGALVGEFVDLESPNDSEQPVRETDEQWTQGRGDPGFEAQMAYFWIDRTQRLIQSLGFDDVRNESFPVVPVERSEVDNAFFTDALQTIFLGVGSDDRNAGEDAQVIVHEYGHALLHDQVPDISFNEAAGAYDEAFGDVVAFLTTLGLNNTDDPACMFPWFLGRFGPDGRCLRRMDSGKVFPDDLVNEVHLDGEIWTSAIFDITNGLLDGAGLSIEDCAGSDACDEIRDRLLATSLGTNEFLTGNESYPDFATAFLAANAAQFGGADNDLIADVFADHGLDGGGAGTFDPNGDPQGDAAGVQAVVDITHTFRGDLSVTIGVVDADFDRLCGDLVLLQPSQDPGDNVTGAVDLTDTDCAEFVPPSPDQQWFLSVVDTAGQDVGQINGFAVVVDGQPFLATGVPAPIADDDPTGTAVLVNGSGHDVPQEGTEPPEEGTDAGVPFITLAVSHTFVGDLSIRAGVASADGTIRCSVPVLDPQPNDDRDDVSGNVDMSACADFLPPSGDQIWFLEVVDHASQDSGAIEVFEVHGPDGALLGSIDGSIDIPDDDPGGALALVPTP